MTRARKRPGWPFGADTASDRSRTVAAYCWAALAEENPDKAEEVRRFFEQWQEAYYLAPGWVTAGPGVHLTREQVAELAHRTPEAVTMWRTRGIVRGGRRYLLTPRPSGRFDPDDVEAFIRLLNTTDQPPPPAEPSTWSTR